MPTTGRERNKIFIVIGLSVLFFAVGYFRFFHGAAIPSSGITVGSGTPAGGGVEVPVRALTDIPPTPQAPEGPAEPPRTTLRNIFARGSESSEGSGATAVTAAIAKPLPSLKLSGTITGGTRPLAFINGQSLRLGEKIEGLQVISITRNQVSLEGEGHRMLLNVLEGPEGVRP